MNRRDGKKEGEERQRFPAGAIEPGRRQLGRDTGTRGTTPTSHPGGKIKPASSDLFPELIGRRAGWRMDWRWAQRERVKVTHHNKDLLFFLPFASFFYSHLRSHCLQLNNFNFNLPLFFFLYPSISSSFLYSISDLSSIPSLVPFF